MRILPFAALALSAGLFACGGDDPITVDANRPIDANTGPNLMGLGQLCNDTAPCDSGLTCLVFSDTATSGYCTPVCQEGWMATSDAAGMIPREMLMLPATATQTCADAFMSTTGRPVCGLAIDIQPAPPIQPSTTYTIDYACAIVCTGTNECPNGLVADTTVVNGACLCIPPA